MSSDFPKEQWESLVQSQGEGEGREGFGDRTHVLAGICAKPLGCSSGGVVMMIGTEPGVNMNVPRTL